MKLFPEIEDDLDEPRVPQELAEVAPLKLVKKFVVLWEGWETDNDAWVIDDRHGKRYLVATSHGAAFVAAKEFLEERMAFYQNVYGESLAALNLLNGQ